MSAGVEFADSDTLGDARAWLREQVIGRGASCPCCSQFARVYRRKIGAAMARDLVAMHRAAGEAHFRIPDVLGYSGGDAAKLRYWGLIEQSDQTDDFRVTHRGRQFIDGLAVPKYALVFDGRLMGFDDAEQVTIHDCLRAGRFSLEELLGNPSGETPCPAF